MSPNPNSICTAWMHSIASGRESHLSMTLWLLSLATKRRKHLVQPMVRPPTPPRLSLPSSSCLLLLVAAFHELDT